MEPLAPTEPALTFEELEAFLKRLKPTKPAPVKRPLRLFDPDQDEWGWQQEEN